MVTLGLAFVYIIRNYWSHLCDHNYLMSLKDQGLW